MLRGAVHVHSTYSDGEFTLAELRRLYIAADCDFVCMTDHAEAFDADQLAAYITECRLLSDDRFRFIAGLEYSCDRRMHVLGFGVTSPANSKDPQEVIRHIKREGGISVIAHPMDSAFEWIESFRELPHGIEIWNSKYDGRYAPRPGTFHLLNRLQQRSPELLGFYGQDMHYKKQYRGLFNTVRCQVAEREAVLTALTHGAYTGIKGDLEMPSNGRLPAGVLARFGKLHEHSDRIRRLIKWAQKTADEFGVPEPATLKTQLRRIL
jgi:hypothetical protein